MQRPDLSALKSAALPALAVGVIAAVGLVVACGGDNNTPPPAGTAGPADAATSANPENTGQSCSAPAECYPDVDGGTLQGEVQCLTRVPGGYCTHLCNTDTDCCAVPGECRANLKQVCSPFESTGQKMCFLSCEDSDVRAAPLPDGGVDGGAVDDATLFCTTYASSAFSCRSSGGGRENRKVCVP